MNPNKSKSNQIEEKLIQIKSNHRGRIDLDIWIHLDRILANHRLSLQYMLIHFWLTRLMSDNLAPFKSE